MEETSLKPPALTGVFSYPSEAGERVFNHPKVKLCAEWSCGGDPLFVGVANHSPEFPGTMLAYVWKNGGDLFEIIFEGAAMAVTNEAFEGHGAELKVPSSLLRGIFKNSVRLGMSVGGDNPLDSVWAMANPGRKNEVQSITILDEGSNLIYQFVNKDGNMVFNK